MAAAESNNHAAEIQDVFAEDRPTARQTNARQIPIRAGCAWKIHGPALYAGL